MVWPKNTMHEGPHTTSGEMDYLHPLLLIHLNCPILWSIEQRWPYNCPVPFSTCLGSVGDIHVSGPISLNHRPQYLWIPQPFWLTDHQDRPSLSLSLISLQDHILSFPNWSSAQILQFSRGIPDGNWSQLRKFNTKDLINAKGQPMPFTTI